MKHYLREHFGTGWEDMWQNHQDREYMIETMYANGIITIQTIYQLGYSFGFKQGYEANERHEQYENV